MQKKKPYFELVVSLAFTAAGIFALITKGINGQMFGASCAIHSWIPNTQKQIACGVMQPLRVLVSVNQK